MFLSRLKMVGNFILPLRIKYPLHFCANPQHVLHQAVRNFLGQFHPSGDNADDLLEEIRSLIPTDEVLKDKITWNMKSSLYASIATGIRVITVYVNLVWMSVLCESILLITYVDWSAIYCICAWNWLVHRVTAVELESYDTRFSGIPGNNSGLGGEFALS